jgi:hypothetical protein
MIWQVTNNVTRGWFIPPTGNQVELPIWAMVAAILPGILLYIILFIETEICQLIIIERSKVIFLLLNKLLPFNIGCIIQYVQYVLTVIMFLTAVLIWVC